MSDEYDPLPPLPPEAPAPEKDAADRPVGVLLLYLGGPDGPEAIHPFLVNLFSDRQIIRFPGWPGLQRWIARWIAGRRAPSVAERYRELGSFPLLPNSLAQARGLEQELDRRRPGRKHSVLLGFRYWQPFVDDALYLLNAQGVRSLVVLPLYPQYSMTTTGSSLAQLFTALQVVKHEFELRVVDRYSKHPAYIELLVSRIVEGLARWPEEERSDVALVCTAHSVPLSFVEEGDPYPAEIEMLRKKLSWQLEAVLGRPVTLELGYQSRSGPVRWLGPELTQRSRELLAAGKRDFLLIPLSFVSDHLETLYELDRTYREQMLAAGARRVERTCSFNDDPRFIGLLADIVEHALAETVP